MSKRMKTNGPLTVSDNGLFFSDRSGKAVLLSGCHNWNNLQDMPVFTMDYEQHLNFLQEHNNNFFRLWTFENRESGGEIYYPLPYPRTGPGIANDGGLKFDASGIKWDQSYFDRLRTRVKAAGDCGIYVSVMLFQGWSVNDFKGTNDPFVYHWFNSSNNINGIGTARENAHTADAPDEVIDSQKAYIRKVLATVDDLDNVIYEISNEDSVSSLGWQQDMVAYIRSLTGKPVGITSCYGNKSDDEMHESNADWISPVLNVDPPAASGNKVLIMDTDHYPETLTATCWDGMQYWIWKAFMRGYNPILMDGCVNETEPNDRPKARWACGDAVRFAGMIDLAGMSPQDGLSSTAYCLANPGFEYLVFQPCGCRQIDVKLGQEPRKYAVVWWDCDRRIEITVPDSIASGNCSFMPPDDLKGPAMLFLKAKPY